VWKKELRESWQWDWAVGSADLPHSQEATSFRKFWLATQQ